MSWILFWFASLVAVATSNAMWPIRRPWWLKLASFNAGWFVNELPLHALAGQACVVAILVRLGALDDLPGQAGVAVTVASTVGLVVLAVADRRAGNAVDEALREAIRAGGRTAVPEARRGGQSMPRSWLVLPWLAWCRVPGVERVADVVYRTVAGRELKLDLYRPTGHQRDCPVLVEIHGGGWIAGDRRLEARPLLAHMASRGWVCVSVDYRVGRSATWPDQLIDVRSALAWVCDHITEYGGDPDFVAVTGGSAGGHLAALAALTANDHDDPQYSGQPAPVRACVPFYGPYDFANSLGLHPAGEMRLVERFVVKAPLAGNRGLYERAAPLAQIHGDAPPFLVVQGTSDNLVFPAESRAFVERMRSTSQAAVAYVEVPRGHHEFDAVASVRTGHVVDGVARFLTHIHAAHRRTAPFAPTSGGVGSGAG